MFRWCRAVVFLLLALLAWPACARAQSFETISIRPAQSRSPRDMRIRVAPNGDLHATSVHVLVLVSHAYELPLMPSPSRLSGASAWRWPEIYDIEAKAPANAIPAGLREHEKRDRMRAMLRALLADRFKLVMRVEQQAMPVYALTVASAGPALQTPAIAEKDCVFDTGTTASCHTFAMGMGHPLNAQAVSMDDLARYIENWTDLPVVNRTALTGVFALAGEGWRPMRLPPPPPGQSGAPNFDDLPTLFTVLRKLGLELKQQEATVPVYTIAGIERPATE